MGNSDDLMNPLNNPQPQSILPRVIGLTGGMGMGKTTVANYLASKYQLPVFDADLYARAAVEPGSVVLAKLVERYGTDLLLPTGTLNRARLGEIIFSSAAERQWVEQQIHPYVRDRMTAELQRLAEQGQTVAVLVIPLLFEARMTDLVTEIWVVYTADDQQLERLKQRDQLSLDQIHARISSQMPIQQKIEQADVVLSNNSTPEALFQQVDRALMSLSSQSQP